MADFREEIRKLQAQHTKTELIDALARRTGEGTTSVNPLTEVMFQTIVPEHEPIEYAQRSERYSPEMSRVAKNATALKVLLHERVGRPMYETVETLRKQDFAECIAAVDAYDENCEAEMGKHVPTTLPRGIDSFSREPADRSDTPNPIFDERLVLGTTTTRKIKQWVRRHTDAGGASHFVYVLDCTPDVGGGTQTALWDRRRAVQTKVESDISIESLEPKEQGAHALNQSKRVYYVGTTNDVSKRVQEHLVGTDKSGVNFTNTIPPKCLVRVSGHESRGRAEQREGEIAKEINGKKGMFAYSEKI